ncbi:MAG: bifunctional isocitrate dehydrogenase kinase/phosphatase [Acidimicrobiia bacterium]
MSVSSLASRGARTISDAYSDVQHRFGAITRRAKLRFETRDWTGMAGDAAERLDLYGTVAWETADTVAGLLDDRLYDKGVWAAMKATFSGFAMVRQDFELAETFFNSITRRTFATVGVDPRIEFVDTHFSTPPTESRDSAFRTYEDKTSTSDLIRSVLTSPAFGARFADLDGDVLRVANEIESRLVSLGLEPSIDRLDVAKSVFYRGKGAYLLGRIYSGTLAVPFALALENPEEGISVDAVLLHEDDISILFSFAHSYFHVEEERPYDLIRFISDQVPRKRLSELYISMWQTRHGKTELFRELRSHLATSDDVFIEPPGKKGLVMSVLTLPGFEMVFKVIKDKFPPQKTMTPSQVMEKYRLVFHHDRAGRLVDSQSFEHLQFPADRFDTALLDSLLDECSRTVRRDGETVEISLAYVQRRVIPLDVYVRETTADLGRSAVIDYGNAIRDLAVTGIFPGDLLIKNFGVTRNERVVFYDYDELTEIRNCNFRDLPVAESIEDEMSAMPWFPLGPHDVFPSEFSSFLGLSGELRTVFMDAHSDLLQASWWNGVKDRILSGEIVSIYPYSRRLRLSS